MAHYDTIIRGGTVIDGTGSDRIQGDIAILAGKVAAVGDLDAAGADEDIDASGLIVAPGVIDLHTHYDAQIYWDPYCTNSGWHGVTSVAVGNCGFGFAPCRIEDRDRYMLMMENTEQVPLGAMKKALPWNWVSYPEWIESMRSIPKGINIGGLVPLNSLMIYVMGLEAAKTRPATEEERAEMRRLFNEAMDAGAIGFGFSHLQDHNSHKDIDGSPMVTDGMHIDEAYNLAGVLKERGEGIIQALVDLPHYAGHHRASVERLAEISGRPILHTVITEYEGKPEYHRGILAWLDDCAARGLSVYSQSITFRFVPNAMVIKTYDAWQDEPVWYEWQMAADRTAMARDPEYRERVRNSVHAVARVRRFTLDNACGSRFAQYEGRTLLDISKDLGQPITDLFLDICAETDLECEVAQAPTAIDPHTSVEILMNPRVIPGTSDGGAHVKFWSGGQFGTDIIMWLGRDEKLLTLEQIHHKLSAVPARIVGWKDRGTLEVGSAADIMIYDLEKLGYAPVLQKVYDLPDGDWRHVAPARGIRRILVNGGTTFIDDVCTHATPGVMLGLDDARSGGQVTLPDEAVAAE